MPTNYSALVKQALFSTAVWKQSPIPMLALDNGGCFAALNAAAETLFARSADSLIGQPFSNVLDAFSHAKAALMIQRTIAEGSVADWELDHIRPTGSLALVSYTTARLTDTYGELIGVGAIGVDLTGKLPLIAQFARTNQDLEGALRDLERSHRQLGEMQAQLASLHGGLQTLIDAYAPLRAFGDEADLAKVRAAEEWIQNESLWNNLANIVNYARLPGQDTVVPHE